eukprot:5383317-Amphidinium_carterae.2
MPCSCVYWQFDSHCFASLLMFVPSRFAVHLTPQYGDSFLELAGRPLKTPNDQQAKRRKQKHCSSCGGSSVAIAL